MVDGVVLASLLLDHTQPDDITGRNETLLMWNNQQTILTGQMWEYVEILWNIKTLTEKFSILARSVVLKQMQTIHGSPRCFGAWNGWVQVRTKSRVKYCSQ
jgi:hypothetical protein